MGDTPTSYRPTQQQSRPFTFDRVVRMLITVASIALAVWLIGLLKAVLLPFLVAWLIAYLLEPLVQYNKRLLGVRHRWLPIVMTLFECVLLAVTASVFVVPSILSEMHQVAAFVNHYSERGTDVTMLPGWLHDVKRSMNHYFRGQALVAFIVGRLFCSGFSSIGLPMAIVLGLFIGLLNMVPYLQLISLVPVTLLCLVMSVDGTTDFWGIWLSAMAVYVVVQCIQDFFLTPKIMGKAMGLNPAVILLSLSVWGTLLGFIGLIIALPLTTLLLAYYDVYITSREDRISDNKKLAR